MTVVSIHAQDNTPDPRDARDPNSGCQSKNNSQMSIPEKEQIESTSVQSVKQSKRVFQIKVHGSVTPERPRETDKSLLGNGKPIKTIDI